MLSLLVFHFVIIIKHVTCNHVTSVENLSIHPSLVIGFIGGENQWDELKRNKTKQLNTRRFQAILTHIVIVLSFTQAVATLPSIFWKQLFCRVQKPLFDSYRFINYYLEVTIGIRVFFILRSFLLFNNHFFLFPLKNVSILKFCLCYFLYLFVLFFVYLINFYNNINY